MPNINLTYNDRYFRAIAALLAAHIIVSYGEKKTWFELLLMTDYYFSLAFSFVVAYGIIYYIFYLTKNLDRNFDWHAQTFQRTLMQGLLGIILPAAADYLFAWAYLKLNHIDILKTTYVTHDFQFIVLMLFLINGYYIAYHFYLQWQMALTATPASQVQDDKKYFTVTFGNRSIPLELEHILYFYRVDSANYVLTIAGDRYFVPQTLDDVQQQVGKNFFRINRVVIANRKAVKNFKKSTFGKLEAELDPPVALPAVVSQKKASSFKTWINN